MINYIIENMEWILSGIGVALVLGVISFMHFACLHIIPWWQQRRDVKSLVKAVGADLYPRNVLEQATSNYIAPEFINIDPAESHEPALVVAAREDLIKKLDYLLSHLTEHKYFFVFGGSGTGKSTLLLNYFARAIRRGERGMKYLLLPIGHALADSRIENCIDKRNTVLLLDAFDEDELAIADYDKRIRKIVELTDEYCKVVITCRSQFFPKDRYIPEHLGRVRGPRAAGRRAEHFFYRFYLAPFSDKQVKKYLSRKFPFPLKWKKRCKANRIVSSVPYLVARPMLLAQIDDLISENKVIKYSFELYHVMVDAWLKREEGVHEEIQSTSIMEFCANLAVESFSRMRVSSSGNSSHDYQRFTPDRLHALGVKWGLDISQWQLTGRSLLNRDGNGFYKFAHRSIMEYFVVEAFIAGNFALVKRPWTDQMIAFLKERVTHGVEDSIKCKKELPSWIPKILHSGYMRIAPKSYRDHKAELIRAVITGAIEGGLRNWISIKDQVIQDRLMGLKWWVSTEELLYREALNDCILEAEKESGLVCQLPNWDQAYSLYLCLTFFTDEVIEVSISPWLQNPHSDDFVLWTNTLLTGGEQSTRVSLLFPPPTEWSNQARFALVSI